MSMNFSFEARRAGAARGERPAAADPFRLLVIGDFSGRGSRGVVESLNGRRAHKVDLDRIDSLPKELGTMAIAGGVEVDVLEMDDLHADELYRKHDLFARLRSLRKRLRDNTTFEAAAEEVRSWAASPPSPSSQVESKPDPSHPPPGSDFEALLGGSPGASVSKAALTVDQIIREAIGPHIVPATDPQQSEYVSLVDRAIADRMRTILHDPAWQGVESAWRGLDLLVRRIELDESLTLHLMDASAAEIAKDVTEGNGEGIGGMLTDPGRRGGAGWALVVVLANFGPSVADAGVARSLAALAAEAGVPIFAGASGPLYAGEHVRDHTDAAKWPASLGESGGADARAAWADFAASPEAASIGLFAPRFLLRLPYGSSTEPVDGFDFEELDAESPDHSGYLWGNPGLLGALLLAEGFTAAGWSLAPAGSGEVDDLAVHALADGGMKPCGEAWLSEKSAEALMARNLCPVVSIQNRGAVQVHAIKSLAGTQVATRWA